MSFDSHLRWRIQMMLPCPEAPSVVFLLCSPICPLLLIYFLIPAWPSLPKSVLPETGDRNQRERGSTLINFFLPNLKWAVFLHAIGNCNPRYALIMQLYFASVTMGCLGLSCLQIFANFAAELCCRPELFWSQLTLTIIYIFLLFQTGVPHYEDFISKAGKLHSHLKWVVPYQPRLLTGFCDHLYDQSLMLSTTQCTPSKFMRAFYLKLSIFCSGSLPAIYEPFSLNIRVLEGLGYHIGVAVKCCDYISFSPFFCYAPPLSQYHNNYFS